MDIHDPFQDISADSSPLWVRDVGGETPRWQDYLVFPTQVVPTTDWEAASAAAQRRMGVPPTGLIDERGRAGGGG